MRDPCSGIALTLPGQDLPGLPCPKPPKKTGDRHLHPGSAPPAAAHQLELRSLPGGILALRHTRQCLQCSMGLEEPLATPWSLW